ncbi:MAG: HD domain-containing phosphohydrolase [Planctomycetota bacterium]
MRPAPAILVVDDEPAVCELVALHLQSSGFKVECQTSPRGALRAAIRQRFDAFLIDRLMREMPGEELMVRILEQRPTAAVILMTGKPDVAHAVGSLQAGAYDYVTKPLDFVSLPAAIHRAIEQARLRAESTSLQEIIRGLVNAIEAKDPYTRGHGERVAAVALTLARHLGLPQRELEILRMAALLHDVGKIGIPDEILLKHGPLSESECAEIRKHPDIGARIVQPISNLREVGRCIREHHERWDGRGYPRGLRAQEVAPLSRILAIAEVFDALAHERAYKPAWECGAVMAYFEKESGLHFDPDLVRPMLELMRRSWQELSDPDLVALGKNPAIPSPLRVSHGEVGSWLLARSAPPPRDRGWALG